MFRSLLVLTAVAAVTGCTEPERFGELPASPSRAPTTTPAAPRPGPSVLVRAPGGLRFEPSNLQAAAGETVDVVFRNLDRRDHTFVVDELAVLLLAGPGQTVWARVAVHEGNRGTFAFYCRIPGHRAAGMEGRITIR